MAKRLDQERLRASLGFDTRFERLIGMIRLLSLAPHTSSQLADIFEISVRTIERDLVLLSRTGFYLMKKKTAYFLEKPCTIPLQDL